MDNIEQIDADYLPLLQTMLRTNNLSMLVNAAAALLKNPILVCDASYHILVASNIHTVTDDRWLLGIKRGHWTYDFVATIHSLGIDRMEGGQHSRPIVIEKVSPLRRYLTKLALDQLDLGYYIVLESENPFEAVPAAHYDFVSSILAKEMCLERSRLSRSFSHFYESILADLLQTNFPNRRLFEERIHGSDFDRKTTFRVIAIDMEHYIMKTITEEENLKAQIGRFLPFSWSVYDKEKIIVLADFRHKMYADAGDLLDHFSSFLAEHKLRAGLSDVFSDLYHLSDYREQAAAALEIGAMFQDKRHIIPYGDYNLFKVIADLPRKKRLSFYCSEPILKIRKYDFVNHTDYFRTLFYYLHTGKSVRDTARLMHLHRNSINYRIERIRTLFSLEFDDTCRNYQYHFSCLILLYQENLPEQTEFPETLPEQKDV